MDLKQSPARTCTMDAFLISIFTVGIAEIGDRSLFLAVFLGVRYQRLWPVFWGMAAGLFLNQALSAFAGIWLFRLIDAQWQGWLVGSVFLIMAVWMLFPDKDEKLKDHSGRSIFITSALAFFILEMADKTQLAVVTLAGVFDSFIPVVMGATLGILLLTTPALWLGCRFACLLPMRFVRFTGSALFFLIGAWIFLETAGVLTGAGLFELGRNIDSDIE